MTKDDTNLKIALRIMEEFLNFLIDLDTQYSVFSHYHLTDTKNFLEENKYLIIWTGCYVSGKNEKTDHNLVNCSGYSAPSALMFSQLFRTESYYSSLH